MTDTGHHTVEEVALAFSHAPVILQKLQLAGIEFPRFLLFPDASGKLILGHGITAKQHDLASNLVRSNRFGEHDGDLCISFCCGLVVAAKEDA